MKKVRKSPTVTVLKAEHIGVLKWQFMLLSLQYCKNHKTMEAVRAQLTIAS